MKRAIRAFLMTAMTALLLTAPSWGGARGSAGAAYAGTSFSVGFSYFHDDLAPYGRWVDYSPYGWCWAPYSVGHSWRPYHDGYWAYTELGWTWVSYEPWGWATYHYGRWQFDPFYGWIWVPGTVWAPAWVAWHYSDDWVGWAPLPPSAGWNVSFGLEFHDVDRIPSSNWCFVDRRHFAGTNVSTRVVSVAKNARLLEQTRDATRFEVRDGRPVNRGIDVAVAERMTGNKVRRLNVAEVESPKQGHGQKRGAEVASFAPNVRDRGARVEARPEARNRDVTIRRQEVRKEQQRAVRRPEQNLAQERSRLERNQEREMRAQPRGARPAELRKRPAAERRAFEDRASRERRVPEERIQKKSAKGGGGKKQAKAEQVEQNRGNRKGKR